MISIGSIMSMVWCKFILCGNGGCMRKRIFMVIFVTIFAAVLLNAAKNVSVSALVGKNMPVNMWDGNIVYCTYIKKHNKDMEELSCVHDGKIISVFRTPNAFYDDNK